MHLVVAENILSQGSTWKCHGKIFRTVIDSCHLFRPCIRVQLLLLLFKQLVQLGIQLAPRNAFWSTLAQNNKTIRHALLPEVAVAEYSHLGLPLTSPIAKFSDRSSSPFLPRRGSSTIALGTGDWQGKGFRRSVMVNRCNILFWFQFRHTVQVFKNWTLQNIKLEKSNVLVRWQRVRGDLQKCDYRGRLIIKLPPSSCPLDLDPMVQIGVFIVCIRRWFA